MHNPLPAPRIQQLQPPQLIQVEVVVVVVGERLTDVIQLIY